MNRNNDELIKLKAELLDEIANIETVIFYKMVVEKLKKNEKILKLIEEKKDIQQQLVNVKMINKEGQKEFLEKEMQEIEKALNEIPLYQQYLTVLNDTQEVLDIISEYIQEQLSVEQEF